MGPRIHNVVICLLILLIVFSYYNVGGNLISLFPFALYESGVTLPSIARSLSNIIWSYLSNGATSASAAVPPLTDAASLLLVHHRIRVMRMQET